MAERPLNEEMEEPKVEEALEVGGGGYIGGVIEWDHLNKKKFYFLGIAAGFGTRSVIYPFNVIKTRLYVQAKNSMYRGTWDAVKMILKHEGFFGLYKGFRPYSLGVFTNQIHTTLYEYVRVKLTPHTQNEVARNLLAGGVASFAAQTIGVPIDVISQRLMVEGQLVPGKGKTVEEKEFLTTRSVVRSIIAEHGVKGLFRGYWASILTFVPNSAIWWASYGVLRRAQLDLVPGPLDPLVELTFQALAGGAAGMAAAVATNPLDVVRTRLQLQVGKDRVTFFETFRQLIREEGRNSLVKGVTARMVQMSLSSVLIITAYESVKKYSLKDGYVYESKR